MDVVTGELRRRPDRPRPLLPHRLAAGRARRYYYVRRLAPDARARRRGAVPPPGLAAPGRHRPGDDVAGLRRGPGRRRTTTACSVSRDGRWLLVSASEGTAPRNDLWIADLPPATARGADLVPVQVGVDAQTGVESAATAGSTCSPTATRRAAGWSVADPTDPAYEHWVDLIARGPGGGARRLRGARRRRTAPATWSLLAVDPARGLRGVLHDLATGERLGDGRRCPGVGTVGGLIERPEGGHEAWFGYTDHATPSTRAALRRRRPVRSRCGRPRRAPWTCRRSCTQPGHLHLGRRHDGPDVRGRPGAPTPDRTATDHPLRLRRLRPRRSPRATPRRSSPGSRPAASTPSPTCAAAARRARTGTATACSATSRTSSTTSTRRPSGWSPRAGRRRTSSRSPAAPTAACSSAPR